MQRDWAPVLRLNTLSSVLGDTTLVIYWKLPERPLAFTRAKRVGTGLR